LEYYAERGNEDAEIPVIVQVERDSFHPHGAPPGLMKTKVLGLVHGFAGKMTVRGIQGLVHSPFIEYITADATVRSTVTPAVYYVRPDGDDANPGTADTPSGAWRTIQKAANAMVPGDTVMVAGGTYYETIVPSNGGNALDRITYKANGDVIIDGQNTRSRAFNVQGKSYLTIDGFEFTNHPDTGGYDATVYFAESNFIEIRNCIFHDTGRDGIGLHAGSSDGRIENNLFYNIDDDGVTPLGSGNHTLINNTFYSCGGWAIEAAATSGNRYENNIIWDQIDDTGGSVTYSYNDYVGGILPGVGNISEDPLFLSASYGDFHLRQHLAGQSVTSPAVDAGGLTATEAGLDAVSTRSDGVADSGTVDLGYHYSPEEASVTAAVYYVRPDGDDANPGSADTPSEAWRTIQKAASVMVAGDLVNVATGTYYETIAPSNAGTALDRITYKAIGHVTIDGQNTRSRAFNVQGRSYITIDGFEFTNHPDTGGYDATVYFAESDFVEVRNCIFHDTGRDGIGLHNGSNDALIENNLFYNIADDGITPLGSGNHILRNNTIYSCGGWAIESAATSGNRYEYNIIWDQIDDTGGSVTYSYNDYIGGILSGVGNISTDPLFLNASYGDFHLRHTLAGQSVTSPAVDAGGLTAAEAGLDTVTTRSDGVADSGTVDLGYHYVAQEAEEIYRSSLPFVDTFYGADGSQLGDGWSEMAEGNDDAIISQNRLVFQTHDYDSSPVVQHAFSEVSSGVLKWTFTFNWKRTGSEGYYGVFMQLGNDAQMVHPNQSESAGVAVNLKWGGPNNGLTNHEGFGYVQSGSAHQLGIVSGGAGNDHSVEVQANLDSHRYSLIVDGETWASGVAFENNLPINSLRFYAWQVSASNFAYRQFDDVALQVANPAIDLTISDAATETSELGMTDYYDIALTTQPAADVHIYPMPDEELEVDQASVVFTDTNWSIPQRVWVSAVNDLQVEGTHSGVVYHTVSTSDPTYAGVGVQPLQVSVIDNDESPGDLSLGGANVSTLGLAKTQTGYGLSNAIGYDGSSVGIAVFDSGIAPHSELGNRLQGSIDFTGESPILTNPVDGFGHGTHVAGIIGGAGLRWQGDFSGVAPGVNFLSLKVIGDQGTGQTSDVIEAINWVIENKDTYNIRAANLSLGHPAVESYAADPLCQAVRAMVDAGIVTVVSAGNLGKMPDHPELWGGITSPGTEPSAITVGAINTQGTISHTDDIATTFSSRGYTQPDQIIKPDLVAPGNEIISLAAPGSYIQVQYPEFQIDSDYMSLSGSSMATAFVTGAAALIVDANPDLSPTQVKTLLLLSAIKMTLPHIFEQGNGFLNAYTAIRLAEEMDLVTQTLSSDVSPVWILEGENGPEEVWAGGAFVWDDRVVHSDLVAPNSGLWGDSVIWADNLFDPGSVIWTDNFFDPGSVIWSDFFDSVIWADFFDSVIWADFFDSVIWADFFDSVIWADFFDSVIWADFFDSVIWADFFDSVIWADSIDSSFSSNGDVSFVSISTNGVFWSETGVIDPDKNRTRSGPQNYLRPNSQK
jgi:parallel beta-helix repeat protein